MTLTVPSTETRRLTVADGVHEATIRTPYKAADGVTVVVCIEWFDEHRCWRIERGTT